MISQVIMIADEPTINGRIYTKQTLEEMISRVNEHGSNLVGTIGVPKTEIPELEEVSHVITNLRMEDNKVIGDIRILDTPRGIRLAEIIASGSNVTYHSCGIGQMNEDNTVTDYTLTSISARIELP